MTAPRYLISDPGDEKLRFRLIPGGKCPCAEAFDEQGQRHVRTCNAHTAGVPACVDTVTP